jgi:hypothetical protein
MKPFVQTLVITLVLSLSLGVPIFRHDAKAQKLNQFTELALMHFQNHDYKSAIVELKHAVQKDPVDAFAWCILGLSHAKLGEWREAAIAIRKGLTLNPSPQWGPINEKIVRDALAEVEHNARVTKTEQSNSGVSSLADAKTTSDFEALPPGFTGTDPKDAVAQMKKTIAGIPVKIDRYSSPIEKAQFEQYSAQQLEAMGLLRFVLTKDSSFWYKTYDANNQAFKFNLMKIPLNSLDWPALRGSSSLTAAQIVLIRDRKTLGTYEGSNAFGAKRTITRFTDTNITIAFRPSSYLNKVGDDPQSIVKQGSLPWGSYEFIVPLSSAEAREAAENISCLILFKPTFPYVLEYNDYDSPTIQSPYEIEIVGTALTGNFEQLWVFNQRTGKIYAKFK